MANDLWRTPPEVMEYLRFVEHFIPTIDACADAENSKCERFYSEENSFLDVDTTTLKGEKIYCNPPYSKPLPFVKQCAAISKNGNDIVMLLNMDTSTKWFVEIEKTTNAIIMPIVGGRIAFLNEFNKPVGKNNKPQVLILFTALASRRDRASWEAVQYKNIVAYK